ncbi:MAG: protoporphyrinogen oxidase [Longimicrobiales bacterium]|nr:protoporphyrinogen oxidase [Longimicrobiales bacterium]
MIAIVGGGISGLALGWELSRRGVPFRLFEASPEPGGVIRSARVEGHVLDWGPQRIRLTAGLEAIVDALDLGDERLTAPGDLGLQVYHGGRLREIPFTAREFVVTDALSLAGKLRLLAEPLLPGPDPTESVGHFLRRKLGREAAEHIVGPVYGGLYGSHPDEMIMGLSLGHVLTEFGIRRSLLWRLLRSGGRIPRPPAVSFRDGMATLPRALARALGEAVQLDTPVEGIERRGDGWRVRVRGGTLAADRIVLSVPAPVSARLLREVAPEAAGRIASLRYNPIGVVHVESPAELTGLGFKTSFAEDTALRGVTYNHAIFGRRGLSTIYLGGSTHPCAVELGDEEMGALAVREFRRITGHPARVLAVGRERMPAWDATWRALEGIELPDGIDLVANWRARPGVPGRVAQAARVAERIARGQPAAADRASAGGV